MRRRTLLAAALVGTGLAGCLDDVADRDDGGAAEPNASDAEDDDGDTDDADGPEGSTIRETRFEVRDVGESDRDESASVAFEGDTITVAGTITGNNGCYTARLADARIEDGELVVAVESYEDADEDEMCTQALVAIEYDAVVEIDGELPGSVRVEHDGEHVTTEEPP